MGQGDQSVPPPHTVAAPTRRPPPQVSPLYKHKSWSPDIVRDEEWLRRKDKHDLRLLRENKSVTDDDIDELRACIELGFGFGESNDRLSNTLPALGLYYAVNRHYHDTISKSSSMSSPSTSVSDSGSSSSLGGTHAIFGRGDDPQIMKTRLRQWAQVVACSVRQSSSSSPLSSL